MSYGEVVTRCGVTETICERCSGPGNANNPWETAITTRDGVSHKYCNHCLAIVVESYIESQRPRTRR